MNKIIKYSLIIWMFLFGINVCHAQCTDEYFDFIYQAEQKQNEADYQASVAFFESAFIQGIPNEKDCYLAAISYAQVGDFENAFKFLNLSIDKGFMNKSWLVEDANFSEIKDKEQWQLLIQKIDSTTAGLNKKWREQLASIQEKDQRYRGNINKMSKEFGWNSEVISQKWTEQRRLDSLNIIEVKKFLNKHGYPSKSEVGDLASVPYFVLQRADIETQEEYIRMLKRAAYKQKISWSRLATFVDKMKVQRQEQQVFGTQIIQYEDGSYDFYPIFEPKNVDSRRIRAGLPPIRIEAMRWGIIF